MFSPSRNNGRLGHLVASAPLDGSVITLRRNMAKGVVFSGLSGPEMHRAWSILSAMRAVFNEEHPFSASTGAILEASDREVRSMQAAFTAIQDGSHVTAADHLEIDGKPLFEEIRHFPGVGNPNDIKRSGRVGIRLTPGMRFLYGGEDVEIPLAWWRSLRQRVSIILAVQALGRIGTPKPGLRDPRCEFVIDEAAARRLAPGYGGGLKNFLAKPLGRALEELNNDALWRPLEFTVEKAFDGKKLSRLVVTAATKKVRRDTRRDLVANERTLRRRAGRAAAAS